MPDPSSTPQPSEEAAPPGRAPSGKLLGFMPRVMGAMRLDPSVYTEVEHDPSAIVQALVVVLLAGFARGVSALARAEMPGVFDSILIALIGWLIVTTLLWIVGVLVDRDTSGYLELLRTVGFAASPLFLLVVSALPVVSAPPFAMPLIVAIHAYAAVALLVATREALDISTPRAAAVCAVVVAILAGVLGLLVRHVISRIDAIIDVIASAAAP